MTSKEAVKELEDTFENDVYYIERKLLNIIEKDLEVLEILRKSIYNKTESKHSLFSDFVVLDLFIKGEDATKVKEWLEK